MIWHVEVGDYEFEVELGIDYQPFEPEERYYPGCEAGIEVYSVEMFGQEIPYGHPIFKYILEDYDNIFEAYEESKNIEW